MLFYYTRSIPCYSTRHVLASIPAAHDLLRQLHGLLSHIDRFPQNISVTTQEINIFGILDA